MKVIPMNEKGDLDLSEFSALLGNKTKVVFVNHVSNALGTVNPIETIIEKSHNAGAAVLIDGAQAAPHFEIDVRKLDVDFYVCSAHKLCGPTGVGILYGKKEWIHFFAIKNLDDEKNISKLIQFVKNIKDLKKVNIQKEALSLASNYENLSTIF